MYMYVMCQISIYSRIVDNKFFKGLIWQFCPLFLKRHFFRNFFHCLSWMWLSFKPFTVCLFLQVGFNWISCKHFILPKGGRNINVITYQHLYFFRNSQFYYKLNLILNSLTVRYLNLYYNNTVVQPKFKSKTGKEFRNSLVLVKKLFYATKNAKSFLLIKAHM